MYKLFHLVGGVLEESGLGELTPADVVHELERQRGDLHGWPSLFIRLSEEGVSEGFLDLEPLSYLASIGARYSRVFWFDEENTLQMGCPHNWPCHPGKYWRDCKEELSKLLGLPLLTISQEEKELVARARA